MARKVEVKGLPLVPEVDYAPLVEEASRRPPLEATRVPFIPGDLGWAKRILRRVEIGESVPPRAIECAREALEREAEREPGEDANE